MIFHELICENSQWEFAVDYESAFSEVARWSISATWRDDVTVYGQPSWDRSVSVVRESLDEAISEIEEMILVLDVPSKERPSPLP